MHAASAITGRRWAVLTIVRRALAPQAVQAVLERSAVLRDMQRRHRVHHLRADVNFNITWAWTDRLVGTLAPEHLSAALPRGAE